MVVERIKPIFLVKTITSQNASRGPITVHVKGYQNSLFVWSASQNFIKEFALYYTKSSGIGKCIYLRNSQ